MSGPRDGPLERPQQTGSGRRYRGSHWLSSPPAAASQHRRQQTLEWACGIHETITPHVFPTKPERLVRTPLCDLLGIEFPIIQAGMSIHTASDLVSAVSDSGGLGSLGCWRRSADDITKQVALIRERTPRPFALNHVVPALDEEAFAISLMLRPAAVTFALGDPGGLVQRAHDAGIKVIQQVTTVTQALQAADRKVDIIIAQGSEGGGYVGKVSALALIPQVIEAVRPLPVVASGGIADGRGLAAVLVLGAAGINIGTRFLASSEAPVNRAYKQMILEANAEDAVMAEFFNDINPNPGTHGYGSAVRSLRTSFIDKWQDRRNEVQRSLEDLRAEMLNATREGRVYELLAGAGQSAGLIHDIIPAGDIVRRIVLEARQALESANTYLRE
jgi:enoyl-[acyl-carrier protein] reductase II